MIAVVETNSQTVINSADKIREKTDEEQGREKQLLAVFPFLFRKSQN